MMATEIPPRATTACCGRCGARYEEAAFAALAPVRTLQRDDLADVVVRWPSGTIVDVRTCARCASPIARLSRPLRP